MAVPHQTRQPRTGSVAGALSGGRPAVNQHLVNSEGLIVKAMTFTRMVVSVAIATIGISTAAAQSGGAVLNPNLKYHNVQTQVRQLDEVFLRDGVAVPLENIVAVRKGMTAQRVRELLGEPRSTSDTGSEWDYHLALPLVEQGTDQIVCQYKVQFDASGVVSGAAWRRKQCQVVADSQPRTIHMESDWLFGFDQSQLSAAGQQALDQLYRDLTLERRVASILIVGHTDRLGSDTYNQALSERRAGSVARYLVQRGIPADAIRAEGAGESRPVVECRGTQPTAALKQCLAPNRRVTITVR